MAVLKIGIVGCGGIANQKHMPSLKLLADKCEMVAFCDIIEEKAVAAAKEYGAADAKVYTDYNELLKDKSIDIVHVLTPNAVHAPVTIAAFEAGKNVMCEKPMAHSSEAATTMMDAWKKSGKQFTIGYQNRFRPEIQSLHQACEKNELGDIYFAKAHAIRRRGVPTWGVFTNKELQGGGPLIDIGTHALDITLWMMDNYKPVSVSGSVFHKMADKCEGNLMGPWDPKTFEVEDSAFGFIKMENGATIYLEAAWAINLRKSLEAATTLCGTNAGAEIKQDGLEGRLYYNSVRNNMMMEECNTSLGPAIAYFSGGTNDPGYKEAKQWLEAVEKGSAPLVKPEQAFVVTQILEAIYKSGETGKEVTF